MAVWQRMADFGLFFQQPHCQAAVVRLKRFRLVFKSVAKSCYTSKAFLRTGLATKF